MKIFISSTIRDLYDLRRYLEDQFSRLGLEIVASERGTVTTKPGQHTVDTCMASIDECDVCVAVLDKRFGEVTWIEINHAIKNNKRVFVFVRTRLWDAKEIYKTYSEHGFPFLPTSVVEDIRVFSAIDELVAKKLDNWLFQFSEPKEIVFQVAAQLGYQARVLYPSFAYLESQWSMLDDLARRLENKGYTGGSILCFAIDGDVTIPWVEKILRRGLNDTHLRIVVVDGDSEHFQGLLDDSDSRCAYDHETLADRMRQIQRSKNLLEANNVYIEIRKAYLPFFYHGIQCGEYLYHTFLVVNNGVLETTKPFSRVRRGEDPVGDNTLRSFVSWFEYYWKESEELLHVGRLLPPQ